MTKEIREVLSKKSVRLTGVQILDIIEGKDGSCLINIECGEGFVKFYKKTTKAKRATKTGVSKFILKILEGNLDGEIKKKRIPK